MQKDGLKRNFQKSEYIFSSNCVRAHEEPKPFVETFGEGSRRFLKINPPAIINIKGKKKNLAILQLLISLGKSQFCR